MLAYTYLETCVQQYVILGAVESVSPDKSGGIIAVFSAIDNNGVDDTAVDDTDGFLRMKSSAELHLSLGTQHILAGSTLQRCTADTC
jgi:hypothetical protein